ncbi:MAG TPA: exodeoxyribonuclease VII large subunit, partial [Rhodanobacteraceae bacterium]|nr:exodeoxyribonuclease VII large subunit [Rhodanobacteraceae bacterium]
MSDSERPPVAEREVLTPTALNRLVRDLLEDALPLIWIEGELSNVTRAGSGHLYFTMKDTTAQVRCAMFKPRSTWLRFKPGEGMHVLARGRVSLYEGRGEFQLIVEHLEEAGEGALRREFELLKTRLAAEGLFATERKRALPRFARRIGVVTSRSGAAIRDVLSVIRRRFALAEIEILPVPVQGRDAPPEIAEMIREASRARRHDVLLITRGGGSLEDLWAFNSEAVARAIHASAIPVVSAIGHEIDFTIADFVADLRAPTPSAAAELLVPDAADLARVLERQRARLRHCIARKIEREAQHVDHAAGRLQAQRPQTRLARAAERAGMLEQRLNAVVRSTFEIRLLRASKLRARLAAQDPQHQLARRRERTQALGDRLRAAIARTAERHALRLGQLARTLNAVSPLATLDRGYAILFDRESGRVVRSVKQVDAESKLSGRVADGEIDLRVD